jgi:phosphoribosyl 1,2-cyclic phosphodiesterase
MSFTICILASGSKGNATYISDGHTSILLDAGLSAIQIERRMESRGLQMDEINAVVVSHDHIDHIQGAGVLSRRYRLPVYITCPTLAAGQKQLGKIKETKYFKSGHPFSVGTLVMHPFSVSHDAADPVGFTITNSDTKKIGIATDLGIVTGLVEEHLKACALLVLEANHDLQMLEKGPYPWEVKQRVRSRLGHLSNEQSRDLLCNVLHASLQHVILGHISETNNEPGRAHDAVCAALSGVADGIPKVTVASQERAGEVIRL